MKFTLIVRTNHLTNGYSALKFAQATLQQEHSLNIYFLFDGVYSANANIDMPSDEPDLSKAWSSFALQHNISLKICAASALRRGISSSTLRPGFEIGSIGELVQSCDESDRMISL